MTEVLSLTLQGFLSYREAVTVPLAQQGFVLIQGRNEVSAACDANGVGKTSLIHGLAYNWFGQTLDGRRADAVCCRFGDGACHTQTIQRDDKGEWSVTRTRGPKRLELTGFHLNGGESDEELQALIEARLGFGFLTFHNAMVFSQGKLDRFAQADQAAQLQMIDEIQGLDFAGALARTQTWRESIALQMSDGQRERDQLIGQIQTTQDLLTQLREAQASFAETKQGRIVQAQQRAEQERQALLGADKVLQEARDLVRGIKPLEHQATRRLSAQQALQEAQVQVSSYQRGLAALEQTQSTLGQAERCPTCRRPVSGQLWDQHLKLELRSLHESLDNATRAVLRAQEALVTVPDPSVDLVRARTAETALSRHEQQAKLAQERSTQALQALSDERRAKFEGTATMTAAEGQIAQAERRLRVLETQESKWQRTYRVAEYWIGAFGDRGIRSLLFEGVSGYLNERLIAHLHHLAAGEASLVASSERTLKKGGTRERLTFTPEWIWGGQGVGAPSYGQDRRADLALFAALQDLSESRSARPFPLKFYDEPGDALDAKGRELFLEWISREARRRGTGFLTTHSAELAALANPDRVWTIVLDKNGSRIEFA